MYEKDLETEYKKHPFKATIQLNRYMFISRFISNLDIVVDIGCAEGYAVNLYSTISQKAYGIDLNPPSKGNDYKLEFIKGDIRDIDLTKYLSSVIVMNDFIEHFNYEDGVNLIKKCYNALPKYGLFIIGTPNIKSYEYRSKESKAVHKHEYEPNEIEDLCSKIFMRVFTFSMNNEYVKPGLDNMSWFTFLVCIK